MNKVKKNISILNIMSDMNDNLEGVGYSIKKYLDYKGLVKVLKELHGRYDATPLNEEEIDLAYCEAHGGDCEPQADEPGTIAFWDKTKGKIKLVEAKDVNAEDYPLDNYIPIGVQVVPSSHDVYGDGSCAIMSLKGMRYNTPNIGGTDQGISWGQNGFDISELKNFDVANEVDASGVLTGTTSNAVYLPSTKFTSGTLSIDEISRYNSSPYAPSPYLVDGSRNLDYSSKEKSEFNALSDFDGVGNSKILCDLATAQANWKSDATIQNQSGSGYSPAACCCWRYSTEGTSQGDWYLPACGELGYMMARFSEIQSALEKIRTTYSTDLAVLLGTSNYYWSSTEYSNIGARGVDASNGSVNGYTKYNGNYVRAFLRVGGSQD